MSCLSVSRHVIINDFKTHESASREQFINVRLQVLDIKTCTHAGQIWTQNVRTLQGKHVPERPLVYTERGHGLASSALRALGEKRTAATVTLCENVCSFC